MLAAIVSLTNRQRYLLLLFAVVIYQVANFANLRLHSQRVISMPAETSQKGSYPQQQHHELDMIIVQSTGNLMDRVTAFNAFLLSYRDVQLKEQGSSAWNTPTSRPLNVVSGRGGVYLQLLSNYSKVTTVVLPWLTNSPGSMHQNNFNVLIKTFYEWTADDALCSLIEVFGMNTAADFNRSCNRNINNSVRPSSLQLSSANMNYVFHMHIHRDAIVTDQGTVITDGLKLVLYGCGHNSKPSVTSHLDTFPLYNEVYVVSQGIWGYGIFHRMVEIVPRVALLVNFLNANPEIRILVPEMGGRLAQLLRIIGLDKPRLVTGVTRAKIVYQPRATPCGHANIQETQILSQLYRDYIKHNFPFQPRNRLILIRRSRRRKFSKQQSIETLLQRVAKDFNLTYTLYIDNPTPSLNETMMMFHSAVIIVAPHGAGLSNMLFSQPGTYVVEGVCDQPKVNLCYLRLAYVLGHHWHGVMSQDGCPRIVNVSPLRINDAVREYLRLWSS